MKHPLVRRTSPKGQPFLGTCATCGKTDIPFEAVSVEECKNPTMTYEQAILTALSATEFENSGRDQDANE
jgi:hypothetical protein